MPKTSS
ncbi:aee2709b-0d9f-4228-9f23-158e612aef5f [Thermothielavioides terrestris]|nr:aee2709b-0d9f-4228-9f23-158e612aef5f [Thermothielavioides terrestris]